MLDNEPAGSRKGAATSFATGEAVELLSRERPIGERLERWVEHDGCELQMVAGTDFALTELGLLRRLEPRASVRCRVFHGLAGVNFHPKLYLVDQGDRRRDVA